MFFWLLFFQPQVSFFEHEANALNSSGPRTVIRHPLTNGNIGAILIVTNISKPGINSARLAVTYDLTSQRWSIENQDGSAQLEGFRYHVAVVLGPDGFRHQATDANTEFNYSYLDQPGLN